MISIVDSLIKRVPFIKQYKIIKRDKDRFHATRMVSLNDHKIYMGDDVITFDLFTIDSKITYAKQIINRGNDPDDVFHYFRIEHDFLIIKPENMGQLQYRVLLNASDMIFEKYKYNKEIHLKGSQEISEEVFNQIINDMNKNLFEFEEYTQKNHMKFF